MERLSFVGKRKFSNELAFRVIALFTLTFSVVFLQGCEQIGYYGQAVQGHIDIMFSQESIDNLIDDPKTDPKLKKRLNEVVSALEFAEHELSIPQAQTNYRSFVQLDRQYPVWSVVAAPDDSLTPRQWCYPFVGCASYRGYYSEQAALAYARAIADEGNMDTHVGGADAYSTLGWFDDPVLSTFFRRDEIGLHALIFHELAHQVLYLKGDSTFNESFASAVEESGVELWLKDRPELITKFQARRERSKGFTQLLRATRTKLDSVYQSDLSRNEKLEQKEQILSELTENYKQLKHTQWQDYAGYDRWFEKPVNNARLALVSTYNRWVPAFKEWIQQCNYDFPTFYEEVRKLSEQEKEERERVLNLFTSQSSRSNQTDTTSQTDTLQSPKASDTTDAQPLPCKYSPNN
ncbi:aminopeptidase [Litoribrevibacter euphylliae]|uniref:Aminopeptidase n=1 Tax=Litoribrevibacter euphylliae TaxID=1834034 RepID=A0ABV7H7E4_9GAMM